MRVVKPHFYGMMALILLLAGSVFAQDATPTPTEDLPPQLLKIWWPDLLAAAEDEQIYSVLVEQTNAFVSSRENTLVEARLRRVGTTGGIMSTLRTGSLVAENALPTVTLVRRQDLVVAQSSGYIQSLENLVPSAIQGDLDTALPLGQVNNELYSLPYMLYLQHVIYRPDDLFDFSGWAYADLIARQQPFVFAAGRENGLSEVALLQYLAAGGTINRNELVLNEEALQTIYNFYEEASDLGIINGFNLNFMTSTDYLQSFINADYNAGVFTSTQYLTLYQSDPTLQIAPIPTPTGEIAGILNGWMWVIVASEPQQQQLALDYIMWMMDTERQAEVAQTIHMLPSRRTALTDSLGAIDASLYVELLNNATLPLTDVGSSTLARSIQEGLASILTLERTAEQAFDFVIQQQPE